MPKALDCGSGSYRFVRRICEKRTSLSPVRVGREREVKAVAAATALQSAARNWELQRRV